MWTTKQGYWVKRMMNYQCEHCGAYLDPAEKCDCQDEKEVKLSKIMDMLFQTESGQYALNIGGINDIRV